MTTDNSSLDRMTSTLVVWIIAALAAALLVALMIFFGDFGYTGPVFLGLIIWALLGFILMKFIVDLPPAPAVGFADVPMVKSEASPTPAPAPKPAPKPEPVPASKPEPAAAPAPAPGHTPAPTPASAPTDADKPATLDAARDGGPDDLKMIKGVGPKLEGLLHTMGFYHFDQVAAWTDREIGWVDENLEGFKGRVSRDEWVSQAKILASGGETEFSKRK